MHNDLEVYLQNIYQALNTLDSSTLSTPQEYRKASETLSAYYDLPIADSLALELIRRNCQKESIPASNTLESSNDEVTQQYIFHGLQMLHELIRRGRWNDPHQLSFGELKSFLLHLALDGFVSSHLTQNKLAAVIVELALIHWPDYWPDLFCVLQSNVTFVSTFVILSVFRDLVRISWDFSSNMNLSLEKQRNISKHIEQGANQIMTTLQNASLFLISNNEPSSNSSESTKPLSQRSKASLLDLLLDTLGCFSKSPALMKGLIGLLVDEVIFYLLVNFPQKQQEILDVFLTMIESLAKRQRRGTLLIETLEASDVKRLSGSIYKLSQHLTLTTTDHSSFQAKRTIALIVRQFIEKYGGYLLSQGDYDSLENIWKCGILQGIANPSFTISSYAVSAAQAFFNQYKKKNVPWMSLPILLSLLFFRSLHQGDPELEKFLRILEPRWKDTDPHTSCWPLVIIQRDVFQQFGIPQELLIHWEAIYDHTKLWECGIDEMDKDLPPDFTERDFSHQIHVTPGLDSDLLNETFHKRFSHLKSTIGNSLVSIWTCDTRSKNDLLCFLNYLWDIFINSNVLKSYTVGNPVSMLKKAGLHSEINQALETLSDRLVPYLSPLFVFCDGIFSFMEAVAQRTKLGCSEEVFENSEELQQVCLAFFTQVLTYQFPISPLLYAFEIRRLDFIGVVSPLMVSAKVPLHPLLEFLFEKIFFKVSPENPLEDKLTHDCMKGMSDDSTQKSSMIRRRALYALMQYCERSANGLMSLLEIALDRIRLRLSCPKIEESERYLLIQTITSMASSSKQYHIQKWLEAQLLEEFSPLVGHAGLGNICRDTNNMISFFYGEAVLWPSEDLPSLNALERQQKKVSRLISHIEAVFQLSAIPQEISQLSSGDYLLPGVLCDLPMQKIESGCLVISPELEGQMCEKNDLSNQFQFTLRHPLNDLSNALLDVLLHLIRTFNDLYKNSQLHTTFPHLNVLLALGEDEWKAIQGETPTSIQGRSLRVLVEDISPIPYSNSTAHIVRQTRRHNYYFRMALYRCLGRLGEIHSSFFQYPSIHWTLKTLLLDDIERLPLPQLITPLDHFCQIFFHENNLVSLQTFSTVPVFGLLKHLLLPLLKAFENRITLGLQELTTLRHRTLDNHGTSSAFLLCAYALKRITLILLDIVSGLVSLKGVCLTEKTKKEDKSITLQTNQSINEDNETEEEALNIEYASLHLRVALLKSAIFNDPVLISGLVNFCLFTFNFPEVTVIKKSYQTIRLVVKHLTRKTSPKPLYIPQLISSIFEKCILMILSAKTLCDLTCPTASDTSSPFQCSPLYDFIHRQQSKDGLASMAGSTLYECLFCLLRLHQSSEDSQHQQPDQIKAYPELHELCLYLTRLPVSLSEQDFNIFMTQLLKPSAIHNIKTIKTTLISLLSKNTQVPTLFNKT